MVKKTIFKEKKIFFRTIAKNTVLQWCDSEKTVPKATLTFTQIGELWKSSLDILLYPLYFFLEYFIRTKKSNTYVNYKSQ